jgi:multidrug efflux pump subunit AcrA (membrane-fusion protein)
MLRHKKLVSIVLVLAAIAVTIVFELMNGFGKFVESAAPVSAKPVAVVKAERAKLVRTVSLTAEMRPWQEIDMHAKVAGYLKSIAVDIGDKVRASRRSIFEMTGG